MYYCAACRTEISEPRCEAHPDEPILDPRDPEVGAWIAVQDDLRRGRLHHGLETAGLAAGVGVVAIAIGALFTSAAWAVGAAYVVGFALSLPLSLRLISRRGDPRGLAELWMKLARERAHTWLDLGFFLFVMWPLAVGASAGAAVARARSV